MNLVNKKKISLDDIKKMYKIKDYLELYKKVNEMINNNEILPIKNSGGNGKNPALYKRYKVILKEEENSSLLEEINFGFSSNFDMSYYKKNLQKYIEHRKYIFKLNEFIKDKGHLLNTTVSMNERSFQIWGREKFLQKEEGKTILKNLKIDLEFLNYYNTSEPIAYYSKDKNSPQNILILENKDTYYTMRKFLINGGSEIFGVNINTVIYGGGKKIIKAFRDYEISVEPYLFDKDNVLYYFGDLDYEGIIIYEVFLREFKEMYNIRPFIEGYKNMIDKSKKYDLPQTKEGQNRKIGNDFLDEFSDEYKLKIEEILNKDLYIPQEIINIYDLMEEE